MDTTAGRLSPAQRQLVLDSEISAIVYGRGDDFVLIRLEDEDESGDAAAQQAIADRGLPFVGIFGLRDGKPEAKLSPDNPFAMYTACFAGMAFAYICARHLQDHPPERQTQTPKGDSAAWLERLYRMDS